MPPLEPTHTNTEPNNQFDSTPPPSRDQQNKKASVFAQIQRNKKVIFIRSPPRPQPVSKRKQTPPSQSLFNFG